MIARRSLLWLFAAALAVRAGFVWWAPGVVSGDALWHELRAVGIAHGRGYLNLDGSPSIAWMPGWPLLLGGFYALFGAHSGVGFALNALLGALTSVGVAAWGARLLSPRVGLAAGVLYALWPGNVYYAATLMSETFFNAALVACLWAVTRASEPDPERRLGGMVRVAEAGALFGVVAWIKAEPLVLTPLLLACLALGPTDPRRRLRAAAVFLLVTGVVLSPWVVRNHVHFGRLIVTTGTGPANAWLGHHEGASGGQDFAAAVRQSRHLREHPEESGYRLAWEFARSHPREELALAWRKIRLTYSRDDDAVTLIRGVRPRERRHLAPTVERRLRRLANGYWWGVLALAGVGLLGLRAFSPRARLLVLGVPACWLLVHLLFIGGARFHVPETPSLALAAGAGWVRLRRVLSRPRARRGSPPGPRPDPGPPDGREDPPPPRA